MRVLYRVKLKGNRYCPVATMSMDGFELRKAEAIADFQNWGLDAKEESDKKEAQSCAKQLEEWESQARRRRNAALERAGFRKVRRAVRERH